MLIPIQLIFTGLLALLAALHGPDLFDVRGIDVLIDGVVTGVVVARDRTDYLVRTVVDSAVSSTFRLFDTPPPTALRDCGRVDVIYVPVLVGNVSMDLDDMVCPAVWDVFMAPDIVLPAASAPSRPLTEDRVTSLSAQLVEVVNIPWTLPWTTQPVSTIDVSTMPSPLEGVTLFGLIAILLIMPVAAVAFLMKHRVVSKVRKQLNVEAGPRASPFSPAIPYTPKPSMPHTTTLETPETPEGYYVDIEYTPDPVEFFMFVFTDVTDFLLGLVKDVVLPSSISKDDETLGCFNSFYEFMAELKLVPSVLESVDACGQQSPVLLSPSTPSNPVEDIQVSSSPIVQDDIPTTVPETTFLSPPAALSPSPLLPAFSLSPLPGSKSPIAQPSTRSSKSWAWAIDLYLSIRASQKLQDGELVQFASPDPTRYRPIPYFKNGELKEGIVDTHVGWNEPLVFPDAAEENDPVTRSVARDRLYDVMNNGVARKTSGASGEPMHNPRTRRRKRRRKGDGPGVAESSGATADSDAPTASASAPKAAQPVAREPLRQRPVIARAGLAAVRGVLAPPPRRPRVPAVAPVSPVSPVAPPPPPPRITSIVVHNASPSTKPGLLPPRSPILPPSDDHWKPLIRSNESSSSSSSSSKLPAARVRMLPPPSSDAPRISRGPSMTVEQSLFNVPVRVISGKRGKGKQVSRSMVFHEALDSLQESHEESDTPTAIQ